MAENNPAGQADNSDISQEQLEVAITEIAKFTEDRAKVLRDPKGRFKPKRPLEFTWPHFWLECAEIAVGILIAQTIWEGGIWLIK